MIRTDLISVARVSRIGSPRISLLAMANYVVLTALAIILPLLIAPSVHAQSVDPESSHWWKGNLHTHSYWSDGDDFPEMIVDWYKKHGYHFLALSDHNVLSQGERWIDITKKAQGAHALKRYLARFGPSWVEQRTNMVRLKPLGEFRHLFEEPNRFLLIQSEEITDRFESAPVHINATNLRDFIQPRGGNSVYEVMQRNVDAVLEQRQKTGQAMFPHLNHPNFGWGITAEDLMRVRGERFFEVYNGHPHVHNEGDSDHVSTDRMWDIVLTWRLAVLKMEPIFGLAVDDSHHYHAIGPGKSNTGRGWVMVRTSHLTPEQIVRAMEAGEFYASTGVRLNNVHRSRETLALEIEPEQGVTYKTLFIGTRQGFDRTREPVRNPAGDPLPVTQRYSPDVGAVLAEVDGTHPSYTLQGDELYVRAKVISSKLHPNGVVPGELETAWTQPVVPMPQ